MITAFVGGILNPIQDKGNGKTATMTFSLLLAKYPDAQFRINKKTNNTEIILNKPCNVKIYTNYNVTFADAVISPDEMGEMFYDDTLKNAIIAIDEMQVLFDSHFGMKRKGISNVIQRIVQQSRKRNIEVYYTTQQFRNVHKVLRRHTNYIYETVKRHLDGSICIDDKCKSKHFVDVINIRMPNIPSWRYPLDAILPYYDTGQIIFE